MTRPGAGQARPRDGLRTFRCISPAFSTTPRPRPRPRPHSTAGSRSAVTRIPSGRVFSGRARAPARSELESCRLGLDVVLSRGLGSLDWDDGCWSTEHGHARDLLRSDARDHERGHQLTGMVKRDR
jgi:hypothetical protein